MLKITVEESQETATLQLEGKLSGPWVAVLDRCWRGILAGPENRQLRVDLDRVTFVDTTGKKLLEEMHSAGADLVGGGMHTQYIVEQITAPSG